MFSRFFHVDLFVYLLEGMLIACLDPINVGLHDFGLIPWKLNLLLNELSALHDIFFSEIFQTLKTFLAHPGEGFSLLLHEKLLAYSEKIVFGVFEKLLGLSQRVR
jgi:hypothetical protein